MGLQEIKNDIQKLTKAKFQIVGRQKSEGISPRDEVVLAEIEGAIDGLQNELDRPEPRLTKPGPISSSEIQGGIRKDGAFDLIGPNGKKDYKSMFGSNGYKWPDKETNFFAAALSGRHHPGLIQNSMSETVPSDGGFLIDSETAANIHAVALENELVMPRCYVQPMRSNEIKIPAMVIGDHSAALFGGFTASYTAELGTISENSPKARSMTLMAKKLTGLIRFSSELNADTQGGMRQIEALCGKGLGFFRDRAFLKGTGAGQPLGILNADCTIEVSAETGQATSIVYENLVNMMASMFAGSFANSVWVAHQTCIPQLLTLSVAIGLSGDRIPVMTESDGGFKILTRPVLFSEKNEPLGTRGDIMLCDFSQYVVGLREGMRFDTSIHTHFTTDELLSRIIERHDGQPLWSEPLTLEDGTTEVSPFVVLEAR